MKTFGKTLPNTKAKTIPIMMEERLIVTVDINEVTKLFTCLESTPNRVAADPPRFYFF